MPRWPNGCFAAVPTVLPSEGTMAFKLLIVTVKNELTDQIVKTAKKAGASGSTVIPASGTGVEEAKTFFGLTLNVASDVILFLLDDAKVGPVMDAIRKAGNFDRPGTGVAFVLPVENVVGLHQRK